MKDCAPDLTAKLKAELEKEIAAFNVKVEGESPADKVLVEIEENAVGDTDVDAYAEWLKENGYEPRRANPDLLSEEEAVKFERPDLSDEIIGIKGVLDDILSFRELQTWRLVMRKGLTYAQAAGLMRVSPGTVKSQLSRAKEKIEKFLKDTK